MKRKAGMGENALVTPSPGVVWRDQTPGRVHDASQANAPAMMPPASNEQIPMIIGSKSKGPPSHQLYLKQASHGFADAVADVAARATVAAVLHEVATGSSTPLRVMSLPRLRPSVWNSQKELSVRVPACCTTATTQFVPSQLAAGEKLEAVRRRQSFGLQSPSSKVKHQVLT